MNQHFLYRFHSHLIIALSSNISNNTTQPHEKNWLIRKWLTSNTFIFKFEIESANEMLSTPVRWRGGGTCACSRAYQSWTSALTNSVSHTSWSHCVRFHARSWSKDHPALWKSKILNRGSKTLATNCARNCSCCYVQRGGARATEDVIRNRGKVGPIVQLDDKWCAIRRGKRRVSSAKCGFCFLTVSVSVCVWNEERRVENAIAEAVQAVLVSYDVHVFKGWFIL